MEEQDEVIIAGYGKLPQNTSVVQLHQILAIVLRVNAKNHRVVDSSTTLATRVADDFVCQLLNGIDLSADAEVVSQKIKDRYLGHAQKTVLAAFRDVIRRYHELVMSGQE